MLIKLMVAVNFEILRKVSTVGKMATFRNSGDCNHVLYSSRSFLFFKNVINYRTLYVTNKELFLKFNV